MGLVTSNGNEVKSKMKHPSDMSKLRFEGSSDLWSIVLPTRPLTRPVTGSKKTAEINIRGGIKYG